MPIFSPTSTDDIYVVIKSLLAYRANSTLAELRKDYEDKIGDNRLPRSFKDLRRLLQSIPDVECVRNDYGLEMWQIKKVKKPDYKYMKKSKPRGSSKGPRPSNKRRNSRATSSQASSFSTSQPKPKRKCFDTPQREPERDVDHNLSKCHKVIDMDGYLHNYQLMGDDFMLSMAKIDLGYKFVKDPTTAILRIGYCISGLTIKDLARIVRSRASVDERVIVYVGSVDILLGHEIHQIIYDFSDLMSAFRERGIEPIVCTLAPIYDTSDPKGSKKYDTMVTTFNCWLENRMWNVVDINKCFTDAKGNPIRKIYQKDLRNVSGCRYPHLLWNKLGRQRALKELKSSALGSSFKI